MTFTSADTQVYNRCQAVYVSERTPPSLEVVVKVIRLQWASTHDLVYGSYDRLEMDFVNGAK